MYIANFAPDMEPLRTYHILKTHINKPNDKDRLNEIIKQIDISNVPPYTQNEFYKLVEAYSDVFCLPDEAVATNNFYTQNINLTDNAPVFISNYKTIHTQGDEIQKQVNKMLRDNIIEPSVSSYNSPILLVLKKADSNKSKQWRLVVDFRMLNKRVLADKFPLPRIDAILDQLGRAKFFSVLDLQAGFHQISLDENYRKYTAFSTQSGHYQFTRLNISPNSFQRMMTIAMAGLTPDMAFVYVDDIIVVGCSV